MCEAVCTHMPACGPAGLSGSGSDAWLPAAWRGPSLHVDRAAPHSGGCPTLGPSCYPQASIQPLSLPRSPCSGSGTSLSLSLCLRLGLSLCPPPWPEPPLSEQQGMCGEPSPWLCRLGPAVVRIVRQPQFTWDPTYIPARLAGWALLRTPSSSGHICWALGSAWRK